jgi:hypothetical protein
MEKKVMDISTEKGLIELLLASGIIRKVTK